MNTATRERTPTQTNTQPRPVQAILLELAYRLHATKAVSSKPASDWRPRKSR